MLTLLHSSDFTEEVEWKHRTLSQFTRFRDQPKKQQRSRLKTNNKSFSQSWKGAQKTIRANTGRKKKSSSAQREDTTSISESHAGGKRHRRNSKVTTDPRNLLVLEAVPLYMHWQWKGLSHSLAHPFPQMQSLPGYHIKAEDGEMLPSILWMCLKSKKWLILCLATENSLWITTYSTSSSQSFPGDVPPRSTV